MSDPVEPELGASEQEPPAEHTYLAPAVEEPVPDEPEAEREPPELMDPAFFEVPAPAPAPGERSIIPGLFRSFGLLTLEATSLGLAIWFAAAGPRRIPYITSNILARRDRSLLLALMFGLAFLACLAAAAVLIRRRARIHDALEKLEGVARRLAPLSVSVFVPLLLHWQVWVGRDLTFLALALVLGLGTKVAFETALSAPPLFPRLALGDRLRRLAARYRAASPRLAAATPLLLVCAGAAFYAAFFSYHTVQFHWNVHSRSFDLGIEDNIVWNLLHGGPLFKCSPIFGPVGSHFGYHATWFAYVIAPFYALHQGPETLLILQATIVGAAAIPLFLFARRYLPESVACGLALCYVFYPPVHGANLYDFHYVTLGPFFHWTTLFLLVTRRDRWAILMVILTISVREDVAAGLAILGAYLILSGERPKAGLWIALAGGGYFVVMKLFIMPRAASHATVLWMFTELLPAGESGFGGILKTAIGNPGYTATTLLERDKLIYVLQLLVPLAFLPLRRPIGLLFIVPGFLFTLLSTKYAPLISISFQYTANWTSYLFLGVVVNLAWLARPRHPADTAGPHRSKAWLCGLVAASLVCTYQYGALLQQNTVRGGFGTYLFGTSDADRANRAWLKKLLALIPPKAKVAGSESLVPHVSARADAYTIRVGLFDAEYVLFVLGQTAPDELVHVVGALQRKEIGVIALEGPYALAKRGADTARNVEILTRLGYPPPRPPEPMKKLPLPPVQPPMAPLPKGPPMIKIPAAPHKGADR
jgi:uncharacterized membrane protein